MLNKLQFRDKLLKVKNQYRQDNSWVGRWEESWNDDRVMVKFIDYAYNLYATTQKNELGMILLGGTEIRMDEKYVGNFGVTAANGIQDQKTKDIVAVETRTRNLRAQTLQPMARNPDKKPVSVTGGGSILSESGWTPMLNDALIVGGVTRREEFLLALTPEEQRQWETMNGRIGYQSSGAELELAWRSFLNSQKRMFFLEPSNAPRVFTRELLGLCFFGYRPVFSPCQIGFRPRPSVRTAPEFSTYLDGLRKLGFHSGGSQAEIMKTLSQFLFGDENAVGTSWFGSGSAQPAATSSKAGLVPRPQLPRRNR